MVIKVSGKSHPNGQGILIYVPQAMAMDSKFPFSGGEQIVLSVVGKKLIVTKENDSESNVTKRET